MGMNRICTIEHDEATPANKEYFYYHQDHIGSSNLITDGSGNITKLVEYTPYGSTSRDDTDYTYDTDCLYSGKLFDTQTGLYFYGFRYYDPELGRFTQPDTLVPYPDDPQSFNKYSLSRNNPIRYSDPTGHSFWDSFKKWIGHIVGAVAGVMATIMTGGNLLAGFQVYSFASGMINAGIGAVSGDWSGVGAGIGGMVGSVLGASAASGIAGLLGEKAFTFGGGFLIGAAEFGLAGFGAGFGGALAGGANLTDAMTAGLIGGGIGAVAGGMIEGSYLAGWQNTVHGLDRNQVGKAAGVKRRISLEIVKKPLPKLARKFVGKGDQGYHWGLGIKDNYNEFSGTWDFDYRHTGFNDVAVLEFGAGVTGHAKSAGYKNWADIIPIHADLKEITAVYGNIQNNLGSHEYKLDTYTCQTWVNNRLSLKNDHFIK